MDPLSITASAVTLIQVASAVSGRWYLRLQSEADMRQVSSTLCEFGATFRNADTKVAALCSELSALISFLEAVDRTLKECRGKPLSLASIDQDLWRQSDLSLADCKITLGELASLINRIKASAKSPGIFRRTKVAIDLTMYARDIAGFQEKINKSNWALQTMLSAINVSLSLRGNVTQDTVLFELGRLKRSIEQSLQVAFHHSDGLSHTLGDPSDARVAHNLRNLARVAQNFHSSASSTASTIHDANGTSFWNVQSDAAMSVRGGLGLTRDKRQQIDQYLKQMRRLSKRKPLQRAPSSAAVSVVQSSAPAVSSEDIESNTSEIGDENEEGDDEAEFELLFLSGLEEVAKDSMLSHDFAKAETILEKAIQRHTGSSSGDSDFKKLQIQLAVCYFLQQKWRLAEPLIIRIAKSKANLDEVVCNLLHALALANLSDYHFENAITFCKQALQGKRRLKRALGASHAAEYNETLGLLATIYDIKGDPMGAEVLRRTIPAEITYEHPVNELHFISKHPKLCQKVFGEKITFEWRQPQATGRKLPVIAELPSVKMMTPIKEKIEIPLKHSKDTNKPVRTLAMKLGLYEKFETDTAKEVVVRTVSIPSSASASASDSDRASDYGFSTTKSDNSSQSSYRLQVAPKRSFTKKITRFLGTVRGNGSSSRDGLATPQTPDVGDLPSPVRRKLGKGLWSKSDTNLFTLKKPRTRLRKRSSDINFKISYATQRGGHQMGFWSHFGKKSDQGTGWDEPPRYRYGVYSWLGLSSENRDYDDSTFNPWVPASHILPTTVGVGTLTELPDNSIERPQSSPKSSHTTVHTSVLTNLPTSSKALPNFARMKDDCESDFKDIFKQPSIKPPTVKQLSVHLPSVKQVESWPPQDTTVSRPKLTLNIPKRKQGVIKLVAHYPEKKNQSPISKIEEELERQATSSTARGPSLPTIAPAKTSISAKVLYDFKGDDIMEMTVKANNVVNILHKQSNGWWLAELGDQLGWIPGSWVEVEEVSPRPVLDTSSVKPRKSLERPREAPRRLSERNLMFMHQSQSDEGVLKPKEENSRLVREGLKTIPQQISKRFSWESDSKTENACSGSGEVNSKPTSPQMGDSRFSWCSEDSDIYTCIPQINRLPALSAYLARPGPRLRFDSATKDLTITDCVEVSSSVESPSLGLFLRKLSRTVLKTESGDTTQKLIDASLKTESEEGNSEPEGLQKIAEPSRVEVVYPPTKKLSHMKSESQSEEEVETRRATGASFKTTFKKRPS